MAKQRIIAIEDEPDIAEGIRLNLVQEDMQVTLVQHGERALEIALAGGHDLLILDVMLPGIDGFEVLQQLRRSSDVYVIMLTARADETDRLIGLEGGADDYVTKPFSPRELVARVRTVLRRKGPAGSNDDEVLRFEGLVLNLVRREIVVDEIPIEATALEFDLLAALAGSPGRVFSRRQLIERIWGWDFFGDERIVDTHISNLRKALGDSTDHGRFVGTVRGVGYKFVGSRS